LVFFCGAGISYYTGLPGFEELTKRTMEACGLPFDPEDKNPRDVAFKSKQFDKALHLLEKEVEDAMRPHAIDILSAQPSKTGGDLKIHKALLSLAMAEGGGYRLVTTNFDDRFDRADSTLADWQAGPRLCPPRPESWRDLTYLHGKIDTDRDPPGRHLVLTSADFGRAYLQDGWAARFVVELFREFSILFIGYSLNDPIVGYLVDALAADRKQSGRFRKAFVLSEYNGTEHDRGQKAKEWDAKEVFPILFKLGRGASNYRLLYETLIRWGKEHAGGVGSRIDLALKYGATPYVSGTKDADNLIWALSKSDGSIARAFAEADPVPDISWLRARGKEPNPQPNTPMKSENLSPINFEDLLALPSPTARRAPLAGPDAANLPGLPLTQVTWQLGRWLARHRDKKDLVDWVIERGGVIHPNWAWFLADGLDTVHEPYGSFWRLVLDGKTIPPRIPSRPSLQRISGGNWSPRHDDELRVAAQPYLKIQKAYQYALSNEAKPETLSQLAQFEVVLGKAHFLDTVWSNRTRPDVRAALVRAADPLTSHLADGLRLLNRTDNPALSRKALRIPFRGDTPGRNGLPPLVRLCVAAFDAACEDHFAQADALARRWLALGQIEDLALFRRLALHALAFVHPVPLAEELALLFDRHGDVLWHSDYQAEIGQYLRLRAPSLSEADLRDLVARIAEGPARELFPWFAGDAEDFRAWAAPRRAARLLKLRKAGILIPEGLVSPDEETIGDLEEPFSLDDFILNEIAPASAAPLLERSPEEIADDLLGDSDLRRTRQRLEDLCANHSALALSVIPILAARRADPWPPWSALGDFSGVKDDAGRFVILHTVRDVFVPHPERLDWGSSLALARVLDAFAASIPAEGDDRHVFLDLWRTIWAASLADGKSNLVNHDEDLDAAVNAPGGQLVEALLDLALREENHIPADVMPLLDRVVDGETASHRFGRIILASRLFWLHYRVPDWTKRHLIARMAAGHPESLSMWRGFCWSGRLSIPLMADLRDAFLSIAGRIENQAIRRTWCGWFVETLIEGPEVFTSVEISRVMKNATGDDLAEMAKQLTRRLERARDKAPIQWENAVRSIIEKRWPSTVAQRTCASVEGLVDLALAAKSGFPDAIALMLKRKLLAPVDGDSSLFDLFDRTADDAIDPCAEFPDSTLSLLDAVVAEGLPSYLRTQVQAALDRIADANPALGQDPRMTRLRRRLP